MSLLTLFTFILVAYLVGSISSAIIVCRLLSLPDPRTSGSNNPGATNVLRVGNKKAATIALLGDILKGTVPIVITRLLTEQALLLAFVGIALFLGHLYPVFFRFKGGKGIATVFGIYIGVSPILALLLLLTWLCIAVLSKYSSIASLATTIAAPIYSLWLLPELNLLIMALLIALLIFWRHRENISRLWLGQESKIKLNRR